MNCGFSSEKPFSVIMGVGGVVDLDSGSESDIAAVCCEDEKRNSP